MRFNRDYAVPCAKCLLLLGGKFQRVARKLGVHPASLKQSLDPKYREKRRIEARAWRASNPERQRQIESARDPERRKAGQRARYQKDKAKVLKANKAWSTKNSDHRRIYFRKYWQSRYDNDPVFRVQKNLRRRTQLALKGKIKSASTMKLVGCGVQELRLWIESKWKRGMNWENYGTEWHVDHKVPCAAFDLSDPSQQRSCFHYTNLQPLWAHENFLKNDSVVPTQPELLMSIG